MDGYVCVFVDYSECKNIFRWPYWFVGISCKVFITIGFLSIFLPISLAISVSFTHFTCRHYWFIRISSIRAHFYILRVFVLFGLLLVASASASPSAVAIPIASQPASQSIWPQCSHAKHWKTVLKRISIQTFKRKKSKKKSLSKAMYRNVQKNHRPSVRLYGQ